MKWREVLIENSYKTVLNILLGKEKDGPGVDVLGAGVDEGLD